MTPQPTPCPACVAKRMHTPEEWLNHPFHREEDLEPQTKTEEPDEQHGT